MFHKFPQKKSIKTFDKQKKICDNINTTNIKRLTTETQHKPIQKDGVYKMTILKKITAFVLASVIAAGSTLSAYAADNETVIIEAVQTTTPTETKITDPVGENGSVKTETTIIEEEPAAPDTGVDLSDINYTPIDLSGYKQWDGKTAMVSGTNYYIKGNVKLNKSFVVPQDSKLVLTPGSNVTLYKDRFLNIKGSMIVEPKAELLYSGKLYLAKGASFENYGTVKASVSSQTQILGEYVARSNSTVLISGTMNVYKDGIYLNYGSTSMTQNSKALITGDFQTPEGGRLAICGYYAITISGRATFSGKLYLYGELVNSGVLIFEKTVRYYKATGARMAASKSSRLIDYRYQSNTTVSPTDKGIKGIDVSYAQGAINWRKVRLAGINFAIIRASRGYISEQKPMMQDVTFEYNITEATAAGIDVGVYHYLYATTVEEARKEAKFFIETIKPYKITYPVILDVEEQYQADLGKEKITAICKAFLEEIEAAGYYAMIYANKAWLTNYLDMEQLKDYDVWLAQWNTIPTYNGPFGMWQYSSKGIVSGIDGYVDLNISYKDYADVIEKNGLNNLNKASDEAA